ncbi:MAG: NAD-dependent epimerase/dehydratase family protein, partial [Terriglobales bacterium]
SNPVRWNPSCPRCRGEIEPVLTPETADRNGESIYAVTKKAQEDLLAGTCRQLGVPLAILRYATVLGPGQSWHNPFTRLLELLGSGQAPVIHEDGMQTRDFIFVGDVVAANMRALERQDALIERVNVAAAQMPLLDFVRQLSACVADALKTKPLQPIVDGKLNAGDVRHCYVDCTRLGQLYGLKPERDIQGGMQRLVDWYVRFKGLVPSRN